MKSILAMVAAAMIHLGALAAPASEASAEKLLELMNARGTIEGSYAQVERMMRGIAEQSMGGRKLNEQDHRSLESTITKTMALMKEEFTWDRMKADFVGLYVSTFDQSEIDGLIAFYSSPAGQAFVRKMPIVMQKSMEMSQVQMQRVMPRMMKIIEESARK